MIFYVLRDRWGFFNAMGVPNCYLLLLSFWFLSLIETFMFMINAHFLSFLDSFTFWTSFLNSSWSSGMMSSFINILKPFKLDVLLSMLYFCSVELTLTRIILYLFSINFLGLFSSMTLIVTICNLLWIFVLRMANVSSSSSSFK